jgi:hypothetical protein
MRLAICEERITRTIQKPLRSRPKASTARVWDCLDEGTTKVAVCPAISLTTILTDPLPTAFGTEHTPDAGQVSEDAMTYRVIVSNLSTDTFDQIVVFYKRVGLDGVVFLKEENVQPQQVRGFVLGPCLAMESYVVGFFIGDDRVAKLPDSGNMTPELASQLNPEDTWRCIDAWSIS